MINPSLYFLNKNKENYGNALILTKFIIILIFLINFISLIKLNILFKHDNILFLLKDFVLPIINFINNLSSFINNIIKQINFLIILLIPILFAIIYFSMFYLLLLLEFIGKIIDFKLRRSLTNKNVSIIFGDSISLYPFIFKLFINLLIIIILYLEILPVSRFFSNIFTTFKVAEVFKFNFLEETKIIYFFTVLFYIYTIFLTFNLFLKLISSLNSHFILFNDEIVYYENKLFHKTILRIPIKKINYIVVKQNILEKLLNIGSIYIETLNKNNLIKIPGISFIKEKNILIMEKIKSAL
ncbi:MAG: PH domain-containing protein [Spirochaetes bacterium]|nr:PH domain-containing protein [Spirochaetota bacterium]